MRKPSNPPRGIDLLARSHILFPDFSTEQRGRWVQAKLFTFGLQPAPIGEKVVEDSTPDFLRALPRHEPLHVEDTIGDKLGRGLAVVKRALP